MKTVVKKSADPAVNQLLTEAFRQRSTLAWDRKDSQQPQCGFGRLALCCSDCFEGPCRVNPFDSAEQQTICGRDKSALVGQHFSRKASDGALALVKLASEFGVLVDDALWRAVAVTDDDMLAADTRLAEIGEAAATALIEIAALKQDVYGAIQPTTSTANMGSLRADRPNLLLHGHIPPRTIQCLTRAAGKAKAQVNVVAMCGSELSATPPIPVITTYDSQEMPLLTDAVDLLVVGSQCVMPALLSAAAQRSIPVLRAANLTDAAADQAVSAAHAAFERRQGKPTAIPAMRETIVAGLTAGNMGELLQSLIAARKAGRLQGIVYLGGCGNLAHTQDADIVTTATALIAERYVVVTSGCAGAALAKAGLCRPDAAQGTPLAAVLPQGFPPVLNVGSCLDAGQFFGIAQRAAAGGLTVFALMQEMTHNKVLATAVAFAGKGIQTFVCTENIEMPDACLGSIKPIDSQRPLPKILSEMVLA